MDNDKNNSKGAAAVAAADDDLRDNNENSATSSTDLSKKSHEELIAIISAQRSEISAQRSEIEKKDAEIHYLSYNDMVDRFGGIPDMPRVEDLKPHEHSGSAEFSVDDNFVTTEDLNFTFNPKERDTDYTLRSFLHTVKLQENEQNKNGPKILSYHNEATVADYVQGVVVMCLQSLGYFNQSHLCKEMSLFSLRPDLILVLHKTKGIILVIEVKMPGEELFTSKRIAKQVADYLLLQYRLGNTRPFVLLTSYREACLCHLKPGCLQTADTSEGGGDGDEYQAIVKQAAEKLKQGMNLGETLGNSEADQKDKPNHHSPGQSSFHETRDFPHSLVPRAIKTSEPPPKRRRCTNSREQSEVVILSPEIVYSRPFNLRNMVNGVSLAIACGIVSLEKATTKSTIHRSWPTQGSSIDGLHPQVENGKLQWAKVSNMVIEYNGAPHISLGERGFTDGKYILLRELGRGNNGKVFLAVDYDGVACALKFYLEIEGDANETGFSHKQRKQDRASQLQIAKEAALAECKRWKELQPDYYHNHLACQELNNQAVLRMPLFAPVPPKKRDDVLDRVKQMLCDLFDKGYLYKEVRWQHVACRVKNENENEFDLVLLDMGSLLDLESLNKLNPNELAKHDLGPSLEPESLRNRESVIEKQVAQLRKRKASEPPRPAQVAGSLLAPV